MMRVGAYSIPALLVALAGPAGCDNGDAADDDLGQHALRLGEVPAHYPDVPPNQKFCSVWNGALVNMQVGMIEPAPNKTFVRSTLEAGKEYAPAVHEAFWDDQEHYDSFKWRVECNCDGTLVHFRNEESTISFPNEYLFVNPDPKSPFLWTKSFSSRPNFTESWFSVLPLEDGTGGAHELRLRLSGKSEFGVVGALPPGLHLPDVEDPSVGIGHLELMYPPFHDVDLNDGSFDFRFFIVPE